jgi:hypothetical protein
VATEDRNDPSVDENTSFEVDAHTDDQPPRDDLIDPDDIDVPTAEEPIDQGAGAVDDPDPFRRDDEPPRYGTDTADLPESQGDDIDIAARDTEDAGEPPLSDEER